MKDKASYRIEIVEQQGGWWVGEIWNSEGEMVFRAHARSKEAAQRQTTAEFAMYFDCSIKPPVTIRHLDSK